jgi:plasmid replication initiation protein
MSAEKAVVAVQSNKLIEARYSLTVGEARLILAMVNRIKPTDTDFAEYRIPLAELARMFDLSPSNIYGEIDQITDRLMSRVLHIHQKNGKLLKIQWICRAIHDTGSVTLSFVPDLKPYLLMLQREFTIIDLNSVKDFQSIYSIRLYQLLKQYLSIGWREFGLDELKEILGLEKEQYAEYYNFKRRVIMQAHKEMEAKGSKCDLTFQLETIKEGKKITRLRFIIIKRSPEQPQSAQSVPAAKKQQPLSPETMEFKKHLEEIGDTFMLDMLKNDPQAFMLKVTFSDWQRKQS